jgi:hypothetical protein
MASVRKHSIGGIYIERALYQSKAFLSLGRNAIKLLFALLDVRIREPQKIAKDRKGAKRKPRYINEDRLEAPYPTLRKKYRMNNQGITNAIDELLAKGFIEISHSGGMGEHDKSRYALTEDYLQWNPGNIFNCRKHDVRRGFQGQCLGAVDKNTHRKTDPHTHRKTDSSKGQKGQKN